MTKRQSNNLKWNADLLKLGESVDPDTDRVVLGYPFERKLKYNNIGVTASDKFTTKDTNEVIKKIEVRIDRAIEDKQKDYRIKIKDRIYNIERIYVREDDRIMELSLSYAD
jgi:Phage head-tail joining protein